MRQRFYRYAGNAWHELPALDPAIVSASDACIVDRALIVVGSRIDKDIEGKVIVRRGVAAELAEGRWTVHELPAPREAEAMSMAGLRCGRTRDRVYGLAVAAGPGKANRPHDLSRHAGAVSLRRGSLAAARVATGPFVIEDQHRLELVRGDLVEAEMHTELERGAQIESSAEKQPGFPMLRRIELVQGTVVATASVVGGIGTQPRVTQFVPAQGRVDQESFNTPGLVIDPNMHEGFIFEVHDVMEKRMTEFRTPEESYSQLAYIGAPSRYVIKYVKRKDGLIAASTSTQRLSLIAGKYVGKDDPVMVVRGQSGLPAVGEILEPFSIPLIVAGWMRGSHHGPFMPGPAGCQLHPV